MEQLNQAIEMSFKSAQRLTEPFRVEVYSNGIVYYSGESLKKALESGKLPSCPQFLKKLRDFIAIFQMVGAVGWSKYAPILDAADGVFVKTYGKQENCKAFAKIASRAYGNLGKLLEDLWLLDAAKVAYRIACRFGNRESCDLKTEGFGVLPYFDGKCDTKDIASVYRVVEVKAGGVVAHRTTLTEAEVVKKGALERVIGKHLAEDAKDFAKLQREDERVFLLVPHCDAPKQFVQQVAQIVKKHASTLLMLVRDRSGKLRYLKYDCVGRKWHCKAKARSAGHKM